MTNRCDFQVCDYLNVCRDWKTLSYKIIVVLHILTKLRASDYTEFRLVSTLILPIRAISPGL